MRERRARTLFGLIVEARDGRPAGSGVVWRQPSQPRPGKLARPRMPYILSMFTEPEFRGQGVASRLVEAMIDWATHRGYRRIVLHASPMGRPVYERLGFVNGTEMRLDLPRTGRRRAPARSVVRPRRPRRRA